jgi:hypothetical protein
MEGRSWFRTSPPRASQLLVGAPPQVPFTGGCTQLRKGEKIPFTTDRTVRGGGSTIEDAPSTVGMLLLMLMLAPPPSPPGAAQLQSEGK